MVLTNDFVFVHQPKTGGTFVAKVLERIHQARAGKALFPFLQERRLRKTGFLDTDQSRRKHATCDEIPGSHRDKPIVACIRNPYDRYVSQFTFRWWAEHPNFDVESARRKFPHFPDLKFGEFLELTQELIPIKNSHFPADRMLGPHTWQFVNFFFRNPRQVFPAIDEAYLSNKAWKRDMYPVHFLKTNRLNQDLAEYLSQRGYPQSEIEFVLQQEKIFPGNKDTRRGKSWEDYYTPELKQLVRTRERMLFDIFPEFDT